MWGHNSTVLSIWSIALFRDRRVVGENVFENLYGRLFSLSDTLSFQPRIFTKVYCKLRFFVVVAFTIIIRHEVPINEQLVEHSLSTNYYVQNKYYVAILLFWYSFWYFVDKIEWNGVCFMIIPYPFGSRYLFIIRCLYQKTFQ